MGWALLRLRSRCEIGKTVFCVKKSGERILSADETFRWFTTVDLSKYEDKYVSMVNKEVVCASEDPEVAYIEAKKKYPDKEIVLWKVPLNILI